MKNWIQTVPKTITHFNIIRRSLILYIIAGIMVVTLVDKKSAYFNHLNYLQDCERYFEKFINDEVEFNERKFKDGILYSKKLALFFPSFKALAYGNLGFCYFYLHDYRKAIEFYRIAIRTEPNLYTFYYDMGMICFMRQDFKNAIELFGQSFSYLPHADTYYSRLVKMLENHGNPDVAAQVREMASRLSRDQKRILYNIGRAYSALKDYKNAIVYFNHVIELDKDFIDAYYYRGSSWRELGRRDLYTKDVQEALSLTSKNASLNKEAKEASKLHFNFPFMNLGLSF